MKVTTQSKEQQVTVVMSLREAGKLKANLTQLTPITAVIKPLLEALAAIPVPSATRGELRHEWGDPMDMDADIGPA